MDLQGLIDVVGRERYEGACKWAWRTAASERALAEPPSDDDATHAREAIEQFSDKDWKRLPSTAQAVYLERARGGADESGLDEWPDDLGDVPHDLAHTLWYEGDSSPADRLALAQALYRAMPCYANLMYIAQTFHEFKREERATVWAEYRALLAQPDDRLAEPVTYSLWVDFYEGRSTVKEAWEQTSRVDPLDERRLQRVLEVSGPVPFKLKAQVYKELVDDPDWHPYIFKSLLASALDVYGLLNRRGARGWLSRLALPPETPGLAELRAALN